MTTKALDICKFNCPHKGCGQPLEAEEDMWGDRIECPACRSTITIPGNKSALFERIAFATQICRCSIYFDIGKLPAGHAPDYYLGLFLSLYNFEGLSRLRVRAGVWTKKPNCFCVVLETDHAHNSPVEKQIANRLFAIKENPPVSELTLVEWEEGSFRIVIFIDETGSVHFADSAVHDLYQAAKQRPANKATELSGKTRLEPRWNAVLERFGQYISIHGSNSKVPTDDMNYPNIVLHTFYRDYAHADQVLSRIPSDVMVLTPSGEGTSGLSGQPRYHVTHKGTLSGRQIKT